MKWLIFSSNQTALLPPARGMPVIEQAPSRSARSISVVKHAVSSETV
ncbi:MAG: hypothetical protein AB7P02_22435 [Alphaproteobacteria bacterium]